MCCPQQWAEHSPFHAASRKVSCGLSLQASQFPEQLGGRGAGTVCGSQVAQRDEHLLGPWSAVGMACKHQGTFCGETWQQMHRERITGCTCKEDSARFRSGSSHPPVGIHSVSWTCPQRMALAWRMKVRVHWQTPVCCSGMAATQIICAGWWWAAIAQHTGVRVYRQRGVCCPRAAEGKPVDNGGH